MILVEVICAWPRRHQAVTLELPDAASVADALAGCDLPLQDVSGYAVFGLRVLPGDALHDGDRLELLQPLRIDPKQARRRRAQKP